MSDVRIRTAAPGDIAAISRIYADAVRNGTATFEIEPPTEAEIAPPRAGTAGENNYPYLVAERSGAIAGYAYAGPYHLRPAYRWTVEDSIDPTNCRTRRSDDRQMIALVGDSQHRIDPPLHSAAGFQRVNTPPETNRHLWRSSESQACARPVRQIETKFTERSSTPSTRSSS